MDGFGWLLLLFGLLVIAGVYFYSKYEKKSDSDATASNDRITPSLDSSEIGVQDDVAFITPTIGDDAAVQKATSEPELAVDDAPQKIVTLRVVARETKAFNGDDLILSMRGIGLRHGKFGIFHRYDGNDESRTIFSAASLVEPGSFDLQNIADQQIPGISLFLILPGPIDSVEAFDLMISAARALAQSLEGELLDESGSSLSIQRERYLREEIIQYQHSNLVN